MSRRARPATARPETRSPACLQIADSAAPTVTAETSTQPNKKWCDAAPTPAFFYDVGTNTAAWCCISVGVRGCLALVKQQMQGAERAQRVPNAISGTAPAARPAATAVGPASIAVGTHADLVGSAAITVDPTGMVGTPFRLFELGCTTSKPPCSMMRAPARESPSFHLPRASPHRVS